MTAAEQSGASRSVRSHKSGKVREAAEVLDTVDKSCVWAQLSMENHLFLQVIKEFLVL